MRTKLRPSLAIVMVVPAICAATTAVDLGRQYDFAMENGNLLRNWSFEQRGDFWHDEAGVQARVLAKGAGISAVSGTHVAKYSGILGAGFWTKMKSPVFPVEPATKYTYSYYVKTVSNTGTVVPSFQFYTDNGNTATGGASSIAQGPKYPASSDWILQSVTFTTPPNANFAMLTLVQMQGDATSGTLYFDDLVLEPTASATSRTRIRESLSLVNDLGQTVQDALKISGGGNSAASRKYLVTANHFDASRRQESQYASYVKSGNPGYDPSYAANSVSYNSGSFGAIGKDSPGGSANSLVRYWDEPGEEPRYSYMPGDTWSLKPIESGEFYTSSLVAPADVKDPASDNAERPYLLSWANDVEGRISLSWSNQMEQVVQKAQWNGEKWLYTNFEFYPNGKLRKMLTPLDVPGNEANQEYREVTNYNSAGEITSEYSKDKGLVKYWYNRLGKTRFTRHESQPSTEYEFKDYDNLDRPLKVGIQAIANFSPTMADSRSSESGQKTVMKGYLYDDLAQFQATMGFPISDFIPGKTVGANGRGRIVCDYNLNQEVTVPVLGVKERSVITFYNYNQYGEIIEAFKYVGSIKTAAQRITRATFEYDSMHRIVSMDVYDNQIAPVLISRHSYTYDALGRLEKILGAGNKPICAYSYYDWGAIKSIVMGGNGGATSGTRIEYLYNSQGWLQETKAIQQASGNVFFQENLGYEKKAINQTKMPDPTAPKYDGKISQQFYRYSSDVPQSGAVRMANFQYDALERMRVADLQKNGNANPITNAQQVDWTNLFWSDSEEMDTRTDFDDLGRITKNRAGTSESEAATYSYQQSSYKLDNVAGKLGGTQPRDASQVGTFVYDGKGRLIEDKSKMLKAKYGWDDMPVQMSVGFGDSSLTITNLYDAAGNRVARLYSKAELQKTTYVPITSLDVIFFVPLKEAVVSPVPYLFASVSDFNLIGGGDRRWEEAYSAAGAVLQTRSEAGLFGRGAIVGRVTTTGGGNRFYVKNHSGSIMRTVSETGDFQNGAESSLDYLAYGSKKDIKIGSEKTREKYTGKELEEETGLYAFGARWMDPELGVFLTPDPARQYSNHYSYAGGDPANSVDPNGEKAQDGGHNGGCTSGCGSPGGGGGTGPSGHFGYATSGEGGWSGASHWAFMGTVSAGSVNGLGPNGNQTYNMTVSTWMEMPGPVAEDFVPGFSGGAPITGGLGYGSGPNPSGTDGGSAPGGSPGGSSFASTGGLSGGATVGNQDGGFWGQVSSGKKYNSELLESAIYDLYTRGGMFNMIGAWGLAYLSAANDHFTPESWGGAALAAFPMIGRVAPAARAVGINARHILAGEINAAGRAVGCHHLGSIGAGTARVTSIVNAPNASGVFQATVEVFNAQTGQWVAKSAITSFFPSVFSRAQVLKEIRGAFANKHLLSGSYFEGISPSGLKIGGYLSASGNIKTAYPIY